MANSRRILPENTYRKALTLNRVDQKVGIPTKAVNVFDRAFDTARHGQTQMFGTNASGSATN